ncbi:hypothetical protein, partial [Streptomyces sp. NPDC059411]|uniref:hypothetical protein n=1 Tax=Streptomyces sp. NPDC059411 TaxID=3346825 RepID=UPI0036BD8220
MTGPRPKITDEQRRARLTAAHLLTPAARADTPEQVAEARTRMWRPTTRAHSGNASSDQATVPVTRSRFRPTRTPRT